jgi:hypothetical protein
MLIRSGSFASVSSLFNFCRMDLLTLDPSEETPRGKSNKSNGLLVVVNPNKEGREGKHGDEKGRGRKGERRESQCILPDKILVMPMPIGPSLLK